MISKEKFEVLCNSIELKKRDNGQEFYCRKDDLPKDIENAVRDVVFKIDENCHELDLAYKILNNAIGDLCEVDYEDLENFEPTEDYPEYASVYTAERLSYLNAYNQYEIAEKLKEYSCDDIATACAIWYDEQVRQALEGLMEFINADRCDTCNEIEDEDGRCGCTNKDAN